MPFDSQELDKPGMVLIRAAEIVRERWRRGATGIHGQPRCAIGAISEAIAALFGVNEGNGQNEAYNEAFARMRAAIHDTFCSKMAIHTFNDYFARNAEEVARMMEKAALRKD